MTSWERQEAVSSLTEGQGKGQGFFIDAIQVRFSLIPDSNTIKGLNSFTISNNVYCFFLHE